MVIRQSFTRLSKLSHQLWNYKDRFWRYLAEIFQIFWNRVCMLQVLCRFAYYHVIVSQTAYRK